MNFRFFVSGATRSLDRFARDPTVAPYLGAMVTPNTGGSLSRIDGWQLPFVADNAAFSGFSASKFLRMVERLAEHPTKPLFVTVPDVVGDHHATLREFERWLPVLEPFGLKLAFVLQNGIQGPEEVPWNVIDAVFVGGDDDFKDDTVLMLDIIPEAKRRGVHAHMGRVNTPDRIRLAISGDLDSADGSSLSMFPDTYVRPFVRLARMASIRASLTDKASERLKVEIALLDEKVTASN